MGLTKKLVIQLVRGYQVFLSPYFGGLCRFSPSCSQYMIEAIEQWGVVRGFFMGLRRLLHCHPFSQAGWDPVKSVSWKKEL